MIEVRNLVKKYGDYLAVDHLDFKVEKGKIYGFLGPNGAGKSTTMNIMTGYIGATEGDVLINGCSISNEPEKAKKYIGYLPEIPPLYLEMRVIEYIKFVAELKKIDKKDRDKEVEEALNITKLMDVKNRLIKNLSKGYRQRVGLAQAVLGMPEVIILDEPTVGLDPKQIIEIRDVIKSLGEKHTVILSSHIMQEVSAVCDYIMIISKGKMVASDTPENLARMLAGTNTLEFTVKAEPKIIEEIVIQMDGIVDVKYAESEEKGMTDVTVTSEQDCDIREKIFFAFAEKNCAILRMMLKKVSLEDVFLQLTSEDTNSEQQWLDTDKSESSNTEHEKEEA